MTKHKSKASLMKPKRKDKGEMKRILPFALLLLLLLAGSVQAQVTTGVIRGVVNDSNGAVVPNAKVTVTRKSTKESKTAQTSGAGTFEFANLPLGEDYSVAVEATGFKTTTLTDVRVQLSQATDLPIALQTGAITETVNITAGGTELVDTTTATLSKAFTDRQVVELAQTSAGPANSAAGVNNLALLAPGVTTSGGVGVGVGGSVGGQRPRNNNFVIDGVDNNDKGVTGPQSYISPEEVAEFTLLQNQFSAEFARSNGGNFITVTKSGTNDFHGTGYGFVRNRFLNAIDTIQKNAGVTRDRADGDNFMARYDYFRGGFNLGGPVFFPRFGEGGPSLWKLRNKLFFFSSYERLNTGQAAGAAGVVTPTTSGFATLAALPGISAANFAILKQYLGFQPPKTGTIDVCAQNVVSGVCPTANIVKVDVGAIAFPAPAFYKQNHAVINLDYDQSESTLHHFRFSMTNGALIDTLGGLPVFFVPVPTKQRLFSYTLIHNFSQSLVNETRLAYRRSQFTVPLPNVQFPGLDAFPNLDFDDLGFGLGPDPNSPQTNVENNYQIVDNMTATRGNHTIKFGGDFRQIISPQRFIQRERGEYEYLNIGDYLRDFSPEFGQRNVGGNTYYGNQKVLYAFVQDDWRVRANLMLNLGVSYSYQEVPVGARFQEANKIASVPGFIEFRAPIAQKKNFAPKFGFSYSPNYTSGWLGRIFGSNGESSIRGGFSMGYDYIFDNLYVLSNPPQAQQTIDVAGTGTTSHFLANGGIPPTPTGGLTDPATARLVTGTYIPDQLVPYALTWTGSYQREFHKNWALELRYVGTRGVHLFTQNRLNVQAPVAPEFGRPGLPTYIGNAPTQAQINALPAGTLTLADIQHRSTTVPSYLAAGFPAPPTGSNLVAFLSNGNSTYHGGSVNVTRRFANGFQMTAAYTWSHLIDDTTAEVNSTVLSPRRVQDFQNLTAERADSALDHRHRLVMSWIYELPWFRKSGGLTEALLAGYHFSGTYTYETGERITIRSGNDANLNGDNAGDRAILNPTGQEGVGSLVTPLVRNCTAFNGDGTCSQSVASRTVGYAANNPSARYIQTGNGAVANIGRNTFLLPPINNFDISVFKNFHFTEGRYLQVRADFFNAFNHPQYVPGSVNTVDPVTTSGLTTLNQIAPLTSDFLRPSQVVSSNPRVIQLALRFNF
jgi:hypothetical protein